MAECYLYLTRIVSGRPYLGALFRGPCGYRYAVRESEAMALLHIPLNQIEERHILELIAARAPETNIIEYKRETYGNALRDDLEFLADVSSLANTSGGDLIIGIAATQGISDEPVPFAGDFDAEINRLESRARAGLQPRISLKSRAVSVQGGHILVLRVARSYNPPHRIIRENSNRFWARSTAGKYEPNVDQLRELFTLAPRIADRTREFRATRLIRLASADAPVTLMHNEILVLHVVPFSAFDRDTPLPMANLSRITRPFIQLVQGSHRRLKLTSMAFLPCRMEIAPRMLSARMFNSSEAELSKPSMACMCGPAANL